MTSKKSATVQAINSISKDYCAPKLKSFGFKRRSPHFFRETPEIIHGIHFQTSQWGTNESGSFTINLCVTSEPLYKLWTGKPLPKNPATSGWPFQIRLGDVCKEGHDLWWEINSRANIQKIGNEVSMRLNNHAVPYFDSFQTMDDIRSIITSNNYPPGFIEAEAPLIEAMFLVLEGKSVEATEILEKQRKRWEGHPFVNAINVIENRLNEQING